MATDSTLPSSDSAKKPALWPFFALGLVMMLLFLGINKWLVGSNLGDTTPEDAARSELRVKNLAELRAEDSAKLNGYAWINREKGSVQIPIAEAMKLVVPQLNSAEPRPAYPIAVPSPAAAPASPAPAAQPAPSTP